MSVVFNPKISVVPVFLRLPQTHHKWNKEAVHPIIDRGVSESRGLTGNTDSHTSPRLPGYGAHHFTSSDRGFYGLAQG